MRPQLEPLWSSGEPGGAGFVMKAQRLANVGIGVRGMVGVRRYSVQFHVCVASLSGKTLSG